MNITQIPEGFALYKEKDEIGRCALTPTPKGGTFGAFCILPQWRRKGYGSYLLKRSPAGRFGGYDREQATVFTAPLPTDPGEAAFWAKFDFQPEGAQLGPPPHPRPDRRPVRAGFPRRPAARPRGCASTPPAATAGIRRSCAGSRLPPAGGCWALTFSPRPSPPPEPIWRKKALRQSFTATATQTCCNTLQPGTADAVMFNFGWLPGADHAVFSTAGSSIPALEAALTALRPGGVLSAILYSGRVIGSDEKRQHPAVGARPAPDEMYRIGVRFRQLGRYSAPLPCLLLKK